MSISYSLQLPFPLRIFPSRRKSIGNRISTLQTLCSSEEAQQQPDDDRIDKSQDHVILVERLGNGTIKRYTVDDDLHIRTFLEKLDDSTSNEFQRSYFSDPKLSWLPDVLKDFILPAGFPGLVSDDYLSFRPMLLDGSVTLKLHLVF